MLQLGHTSHVTVHPPLTPSRTTATAPFDLPQVSEEELYISKLNNIWLHADTDYDYLGEISGTGSVADAGEIQY